MILNGKGGVGKSFFATNFVQFLKDRSIPHHAIDSANENSTLKRFHPDAEFINIKDRQGIDATFPALEKAPLVVIDCRAASTDIFLEYFAEVKVFDILQAIGRGFDSRLAGEPRGGQCGASEDRGRRPRDTLQIRRRGESGAQRAVHPVA